MARKMKTKRFAEGGNATQQARYNRKVADINSDYDKWLKSGRYGNEAVARAKRDQRLADAADDLAKWTGEDRSKTRAGEAAAEATLREARRTKGASMPPPPRQIEAPLSSEPIKIAPQKMDLGDVTKQAKPAGSDDQTFNSAFRAARANALSGGPKTFTWRGRVYGTKLADEDSSPRTSSASASALPRRSTNQAPASSSTSTARPATPTPTPTPAGRPTTSTARPTDSSSGAPSLFIGARAAREQEQNASRMSDDLSGLGETLRRRNQAGAAMQSALRAKQMADRAKQLAAEATEARRRATPVPSAPFSRWQEAGVSRLVPPPKDEDNYPLKAFRKGGVAKKVPAKKKTAPKKACGGGMMKKYAKGGSIDGCAVRGKTRAKRAR